MNIKNVGVAHSNQLNFLEHSEEPYNNSIKTICVLSFFHVKCYEKSRDECHQCNQAKCKGLWSLGEEETGQFSLKRIFYLFFSVGTEWHST